MNVPCKGCADRNATCHAECERYAAYAAERERIRKRRSEESAAQTAIIRAIERTMKYGPWKK